MMKTLHYSNQFHPNFAFLQARNQEFFRTGVFFELGHFDKHSSTTRERKVPQGKNIRAFRLETLKNVFLPIDDHNQGIFSRN